MAIWLILFILLVTISVPDVRNFGNDRIFTRSAIIFPLLDPTFLIISQVLFAVALIIFLFICIILYINFVRKRRRGIPLRRATRDYVDDIGELETNVTTFPSLEEEDNEDVENLDHSSFEDDCIANDSETSFQIAKVPNKTDLHVSSIELDEAVMGTFSVEHVVDQKIQVGAQNFGDIFTKLSGGKCLIKGHTIASKQSGCAACARRKSILSRRYKTVRLPYRSKIRVYIISKKFIPKEPEVPVICYKVLNDLLIEGSCIEFSEMFVSVDSFEKENVPPQGANLKKEELEKIKNIIDTSEMENTSDGEVPLSVPRRRRKVRSVPRN